MDKLEKRHSITVDGRTRGLITGVTKVVSASPVELSLETSDGGLSVRGKELKINSFSEESGTLSFDGNIDKLEYDKVRQPLLKRIFR